MTQESIIRLVSFAGTLVLMVTLEALFPRRTRSFTRLKRWPSNLGIVILDTLAVRLIFAGLLPVVLAVWCEKHGFGLIQVLGLPAWAQIVLGVILLDLAIYGQHVAFHIWRPLWLLHRMHHADLDFDCTTALRFHPLEILISVVWKLVLVLALGVPAAGVILFEVLLNSCALFNHSNLYLPLGVDRCIRLFMVTPDMHRVHHSTDMKETNSNYGFNFPWWDRVFGTYIPQPAKGHESMPIGLSILRNPKYLNLHWLLAVPFVKDTTR